MRLWVSQKGALEETGAGLSSGSVPRGFKWQVGKGWSSCIGPPAEARNIIEKSC